jgi:hypothetical protein
VPDIPNVPGVPPLLSYGVSGAVLLTEDIISALTGIAFGPVWGIFLNGTPAIDYNSVVDFDYKQDWSISDYQVEDGGFQSYDKVQHPFDVRVRVASGGSAVDRQALLDSVDAAANTLNLYDVVTPEATYSSCNITHYDYKRTAVNGVGMIIVDIWFEEVRVTSTATYTSTASPTNAGPVGVGAVSAASPPAQVQGSVSAAGWQ